MDIRLLASSPAGGCEVHEMEDGTMFCLVEQRKADGGPRLDTFGISTIIQALAESGRLRQFGGRLYLRVAARWRLLLSAPAVSSMLPSVLCFVSSDDPPADWFRGNVAGETGLELLANCAKVRLHGVIPRDLPSALCGEQDRSGVPEAVGVLRHPVFGVPADPWLDDAPSVNAPVESDYRHLRTLFAGLELDPCSHVAAYCYLLGAFHAVSLSAPRPILLVDSWVQGRGKSEVCAAISRLIDDQETEISARSDSEKFDDGIISQLRSSRCLVVDNVDNHREYNLPRLATASTGVLSARHKYSAGATQHRGILLCLNLVLGAASLHRDLISRAVRVELTGAARKLTPQPRLYAQEKRLPIVSEILTALSRSAGVEVEVASRFGAFDRVAVPAYAEVFGGAAEEITARLEQARRNAWVHSPDVLTHLACHHKKRFSVLRTRALSLDFVAPPAADALELPEEAEGCRALGLELNGGEWK